MLNDLYALVYISIAIEEFDRDALLSLSHHAKEKNKRLEISGYLCFKHNMFFQYLEGSKAHVTSLMEEIEMDSRHQLINLVHIGNIAERKFLGWSMRFLDEEELKGFNLEDMLNWIIVSMKAEDHTFEGMKEHVDEMIQQIRVLRGQSAIS